MEHKPHMATQQQINRVGNYLFKNIDGAFKYEKTGNMYDLYFRLLYEVPKMERIPGKAKEGYNDVHEMIMNLNITTYKEKLRMNLIEMSPEEKTLGHKVVPPDKLEDLSNLKAFLWDWILKRLTKEYQGYEFIY